MSSTRPYSRTQWSICSPGPNPEVPMANDARKWLPLALVAAAMAITTFAVRDLPPTVTLDLRGLLPFELEPTGDTAPRWVAVVMMPLIAALIWVLLEIGRSRFGLSLARRLFSDTRSEEHTSELQSPCNLV